MNGGLAAALAGAKLKKTSRDDNDSNQSRSSGGSNGNGSGGMASIMDEMSKTLARRRAQAEASANGGNSKSLSPTKESPNAQESLGQR